jgi:5-methylcytosine-specific restriction protein A
MANAPKKIKRSWQPERKEFERPIDMSWFYNSWKWRKKSKAYRESHPICECKECKLIQIIKPAEVVDHVRGLKFLLDNNLDPFDDNELQSMSKECHNKKSGGEKGGNGVKSRKA